MQISAYLALIVLEEIFRSISLINHLILVMQLQQGSCESVCVCVCLCTIYIV